MSHKFSEFFLPKLKKNGNQKNVFFCCSFWSNYNLDTFSTSKWTSPPKFCERYSCSWQKKWPEMIVKLPNAKVVTFEYERTILRIQDAGRNRGCQRCNWHPNFFQIISPYFNWRRVDDGPTITTGIPNYVL